jgi:hypothetical protein
MARFGFVVFAAAFFGGVMSAQNPDEVDRPDVAGRVKPTRDARLFDRSDRFRVYRGDRYYETDGRGADLLRQAISEGYRHGYAEGGLDRESSKKNGGTGSAVYKSGSSGYQSYVDPGEYRYYFRQGFLRGYQDGYANRSDYGYQSNGRLEVMVSVVNKLLTVAAY